MNQFKFIIGVFFLCISVGCHNPYRSGMDSLAEGNYDDAIAHAEEGLSKEPNDPELNLLMAKSLMAQEKWAAAEPYARKAARSEGLAGRGNRTLGKILWEMGQPVGAVDAWSAARSVSVELVSDDDFQRGLETAISLAMSTHAYGDALRLRIQLAELVPGHEASSPEWMKRTRAMMAEELVRDGKFQESSEAYAALAEDFGDAIFWFEQGRVLTTFGQDSEAILAFQKYVDADPSVARNLEVAHRSERLKNNTIAIRFYDQALELLKTASVERARTHLALARLLLTSRANDQARVHMRAYLDDMKALKGVPVLADPYIEVANLATQGRAPHLAVEFLEEAVEEAAPSWRASRLLAELYTRRSRNQDVERVVKRYVERMDTTATALMTAGRWASSQRHAELAVFFLEAALAKDDSNASLWLELSRAYSAANRVSDTRRALEGYVRRASDPVRAHLDVASIYRRMRSYEDAEKHLLAAFKLDPKNESVVYDLETLYRESGKPKKIHEVFARHIAARGADAEVYAQVASRFMRQNELDDALRYLSESARLGKNDSWLQIADVYKRQRKERDMKAALDKYVDGASDRGRALDDAWQRLRTSSWAQEGVGILEELISLRPTQVSYYEELSELYFSQRRDVEAFELWKQYISTAPKYLDALEAMSRRFERHGQEEWVLTLLEEMVRRDGDKEPELYRLLGNAYASAAQRRGRLRVVPDGNAIFSREDKARENYRLYLIKANPGTRELEKFADAMRSRRMWDVAALAYERLDVRNSKSGERLLHYGTALLNLGRNKEAKEVLHEYTVQRGKSLDAMRLVSDQLMTAGQYDALEPYLRELMSSGDENLLRNAFLKLTEVYRQTDQSRKIGPLISEYLDRTQNPGEARRTSIAVIEGAGLWSEGVVQLRRMAETQGDEFRMDLAVMQYRTGDVEGSWRTFESFASESLTPAESWYRIAQFYEKRADVEKAQHAYNAAVNAAPQNSALLAERGRFRILRGQIEAGRQDFEMSRQMVEAPQRAPISRMEIEALQKVGRYAAALEVATAVLPTAYAVDRDFFVKIVAAHELTSGDSIRAQRFLDGLQSTGLAPDVFVEILVQYGFLEEAAKAIEYEIQFGDHAMGGDLAVSYAQVFTRLGGIDLLLRVLQPILERGRDGRVQERLGEFLVREGRLEQGSMFLRAAVDMGRSDYRVLLGQVYLTLGHTNEALEQFQTYLGQSQINKGTAILIAGAAFELTNRLDLWIPFLFQLAQDPAYADVATSALISYDVETGGLSEALSRLQHVMGSFGGEAGIATLDEPRREILLETIAGAAESLAGHGYKAEARAFLESVPVSIRDSDRLKELELRLVVSSDTPEAKRFIEIALKDLGDSSRDRLRRLRLAQLLMVHDQGAEAEKIAASMVQDGDLEVARQALTLMVNVAVAQGLDSKIPGLVKEFISGRPDKAGARGIALDIVRTVGADDLVVELSRENLKHTPTQTTIFTSLHNAMVTNDIELARQATQLLWRVAEDPLNVMTEISSNYSDRQDREFVEEITAPVLRGFDQVLPVRMVGVRVNYRTGRTKEAREELLAMLEDTEFDGGVIEEVVDFLHSWKLWGELARFFGPKLETAKLTPKSRKQLAMAHLQLGERDVAFAYFDQVVSQSPDTSEAARLLAIDLVESGFHREGLRFAELAIRERPTRSVNYLARGLARLALGEPDADDDIQRGITDGNNAMLTLLRGGRLALKNGDVERAHVYLEKLAKSPVAEQGGVMTLDLAIRAFRDAGRAKDGVRFVESRWPSIASGRGVTGSFLMMAMAGLYEEAGMEERSFTLYEEAIGKLLVSNPLSQDLATYRNNLAYLFSTSNQRIEEGLHLIRLAIAQDMRRNASFIDTYGWLLYRSGDFVAAEREIRKALATTTNSRSSVGELVELYDHLAELRSLQGRDDEGSWIRVFIEMIESRR